MKTYTADDILPSLKALQPKQAFELELGKNVDKLKWDYMPIIYDRELNLGFKPKFTVNKETGMLVIYREE